MPTNRPPRLAGFSYVGPHRYHVVLSTIHGTSPFADDGIARSIVDTLREAARTASFDVLVYCVMPNHVHLVVEGLSDDADLRTFVDGFKQRTGFAFVCEHGQRLWQAGWYDHVLRPQESTLEVCQYVAANPVRAGLVRSAIEHPHTGSMRFTMKDLLEDLAIRHLDTL